MSSLLKRIENRVRYFVSPYPDVSEFYAGATDELKALYPERSADIFFANNERKAYKWLHYFHIYDQVLASYVDSDVRMLEIGVYQEGSLGLWRKLLGPPRELSIDLVADEWLGRAIGRAEAS